MALSILRSCGQSRAVSLSVCCRNERSARNCARPDTKQKAASRPDSPRHRCGFVGPSARNSGSELFCAVRLGLVSGCTFITGFVTSWFLNAGGLRSRAQTVGICALTPVLIGLFLIGFRLEGVVCLLMALPLALPFLSLEASSLTIALTRVASRSRRPASLPVSQSFLCFMLGEHAAQIQPPVAVSCHVHYRSTLQPTLSGITW